MARPADVLPLVGSVLAAAALAGAAVFTVTQAGCATPGHYVRDGGQVRLVGGCLNPGDLQPAQPADAQAAQHDNSGRQSRP